jgi:hypothetical protein
MLHERKNKMNLNNTYSYHVERYMMHQSSDMSKRTAGAAAIIQEEDFDDTAVNKQNHEEEDEFEDDYVIPPSSLHPHLLPLPHVTATLQEDSGTTMQPPPILLQQHVSSASSSAAAQPLFPETASTPISSHFDSVLECLDFIRVAEEDPQIDKQEVIETIRGRLHNMVSKILLGNTITSMSMMGWRLE